MLKWAPYSSKLHAISSFIQRKAGSQKARWGLYFYSALESIIIPVPTDPLLAACVYAAPKRWWETCNLDSNLFCYRRINRLGIGLVYGRSYQLYVAK